MLIGARQAFFDDDLSAKSYIQDGLIAMWDGIENDGFGVHNPNATVWKDLIGTRHLGASQISFEDDCAVFNGNEIFESGGTFSMTLAEVVFYSTSGGIVYMTNTTTGNRIWANGDHIGINYYYDGTAIRHDWSGKKTSVSTGNPGGASVSAAHTFVNGKAPTLDSNVPSPYGSVYTGGARMGAASFVGKIYCVRQYNRALTADEIAINHAIDKARFNLPT